MINKLRSMPAFSDCADEAAVMSRITEVVNKAQEHAAVVAERDALKEKVADLERKGREAAEAAYDPKSTRHARRSASAPTKYRASRR